MSLEQDVSTLKSYIESKMIEAYDQREYSFGIDERMHLTYETRLYDYKRVCDIMGWDYPAEWNL